MKNSASSNFSLISKGGGGGGGSSSNQSPLNHFPPSSGGFAFAHFQLIFLHFARGECEMPGGRKPPLSSQEGEN